jgi:hypothetical protein
MGDHDDLRRKVQESMGRVPAPNRADLGFVERRARRRRTRRVLVGSGSAVVILAAVVTPLALLYPLGSNERPPAGALADGSLSVVRLAERPPGGAYYIEGAYAYVRVASAQGQDVLVKELTNYLQRQYSQDVQLRPGGYVIESFVRICSGNCGQLTGPTERCSAELQIRPGETVSATIRYEPGSGCTVSIEHLSPSPDESRSATPDVAQVVCDDSGTHVLTPQVKPQPDGVHFRLDNQTGAALYFIVTYPSHTAAEVNVPPGVSEPRSPDPGWPIPPGTVSVSCWGERPFDPTPPEPATFEVVDEGPSPSPDETRSATPDVAEVVCDDAGTHLLTPEVAAQPDGVHIRETRQDGAPVFFIPAPGSLRFSVSGGEGVVENVYPLAPGTSRLVCPGGGRDPADESLYVSLTVVDTDALWVTPVLGCPQEDVHAMGIVEYSTPPLGEVGDPLALVGKYLIGIRLDDVVELAGYPAATSPGVVVVRDGETIAIVQLVDNGDGRWVFSDNGGGYMFCASAVGGFPESPLG